MNYYIDRYTGIKLKTVIVPLFINLNLYSETPAKRLSALTLHANPNLHIL